MNQDPFLINNDQIYNAYKGNLGENFMVSTKKRFAWLASNVEGENILDIGCSQGVFPILLAREGYNVLGIDTNKDAVEFSENLKLKESNFTQKNVTFKNIDYLSTSINQNFDTIILAEVLEHLYYPEKIIQKVTENLKPNGRILITVPFGVNNYYDHKQTFYLKGLLDLLWKHFEIEHLQFSETKNCCKWIGLSAKLSTKKKNRLKTINAEYIQFLENAFKSVEYSFVQKYNNSIKKNENLRETIVKKDRQIEELKERNILSQRSYNSARKSIKKLKDKIKSLEKQILQQRRSLRKYRSRKIVKLSNFIAKLTRLPRIIIRKLRKFVLNIVNYIKNKYLETKGVLIKRNLVQLAENIPESNGSSFFKKLDINVAIITDEFVYNYYKDAVNLHYINYNNYKDVLTKNIDFVLFVSCWQGMKNNDWKDIAYTDEKRQELFEIFDYAKQQNIKTVFQTIEDPSNYKYFLPIAKKADYIFTTDEDKISDYINDTENKNVFFVEYGINPFLQNPIGCNVAHEKKLRTKNKVFFAGSWARRYEERCNDLRMIFDGVNKSDKKLIVADRNYYRRGFRYPNSYQKYLIPSIDHEILQKIHKLFDWNINVNSIKYSSTMCAMRVYELQALGTLMLSNYSTAVYNHFPQIFTITDNKEIPKILNSYPEKEKYRMKVEGIRKIFSGNTVFDRLPYILDKINLKKKINYNKKVLVLCQKKTKNIQKMFNSQTYKEKSLCTIDQIKDLTLKDFHFITFFSEKNKYGEYYLEDMLNCFKFVDVAYVTKSSYFNEKDELIGKSHNYVETYEDKNKTVFNLEKVNIKNILSNKSLNLIGYSSDPFELNEKEFSIEKTDKNFDPEIGTIIPVYNNGNFLYGKALLSLLRSSIFDRMHIKLIDDGSSDKKTLLEVKRIARRYPNVTTYFFPEGGSGSASKPRNKGVQLLKTKYITYLDPDNEALNDSYAELYKAITSSKDIDISFGYIRKVANKKIGELKSFKENKTITDTRKTLIEKNFFVQSIQACIFKKELIVKNKIDSVEKAVGQDSLFFMETFLNASKVLYLNTPIHTYYAERKGSAVNEITSDFFKKSLIREKEQIKRLKKYNLFEDYRKNKYHRFFKNWYAVKYKIVSPKDKESSENVLRKIANLYEYDLERRYTKNYLDQIPESNGSAYYQKLDINIAIVTDSLAYNYLNNSTNLFYLGPENYKEVIDNNDIDLFLFITCWQGMNNKDWRGISGNPEVRSQLLDIFKYCKSKNIPSVYWSKEDPVHYDRYHELSKYADFIFTTATECILDYMIFTDNKNVFPLQYGINPYIHNPVGFRINNKRNFKTNDQVLFAGSWYLKHKNRAIDQEKLFDGVIDSTKELVIIDRNYFNPSKTVAYPKKYQSFTYPSMSYNKLQQFQKLFNWIINLNTVKNSTTMCAARVFELQAQGMSILSNPALIIEKNFPNIFTAETPDEVVKILEETSETEMYAKQIMGVRNVFDDTVFERLHYVLNKIGLEDEPLPKKKIFVVCDEINENIKKMFSKQTYSNKQLISKTQVEHIDINGFVTFFSEKYNYGIHYLQDMINGFKYTDSSFITKDPKVEHNYVKSTNDKYRTMFNPQKIDIKEMLDKEEFKGEGYSIDPFELDKIK